MIFYAQIIYSNNSKFSISKKIPWNMTGTLSMKTVFFRISWQVTKDITILDTTKIKIVNVFDEPTACSSEELVLLFTTMTSFTTQQTTVNVQFDFLCKN
jgi:hypothetical protein